MSNYLSGQLTSARRPPAETKLLRAIAAEVDGRLRQSLHNRIYVELDKVENPQRVSPLASMNVEVGDLPAQACPKGTKISEIFDRKDIEGRLLILGKPGSGKTTLLLQLAKVLVARAVKDGSQPVPVLLNLSAWREKSSDHTPSWMEKLNDTPSWGGEFSDISSWIVADLRQKYGVRKDVAEKWIKQGRILPLLDGLNELKLERQESCVQALNKWMAEWWGMPLVVCSRSEEYGVYKSNLNLNGAVIVQPLSNHQIERFLRETGCNELWEAVRGDRTVMDPVEGLARSPLQLTMLVLASSKLPVYLWRSQASETEWRRLLFEGFLEKRLEDNADNGDETLPWLGWLAARLIEESETEFFIERLKPSFLANRWQKSVFGLVFGMIFGLVNGLVYGLLPNGLASGLVKGLVFGLAIWLFSVLVSGLGAARQDGWMVKRPICITDTLETIRHVTPKKLMDFGLFSGMVGGLGALVGGLGEGVFTLLLGVLGGGLIVGLLGVLGGGLIVGLVKTLKESEVDPRTDDNQGIRLLISNSVICGSILAFLLAIFLPASAFLLIALFATPSMVIDELNQQGVALGLFAFIVAAATWGFFMGSFAGGISEVNRHLALRFTLWKFGYSPWNYSNFLRYCTRLGFLQRVGGGYRFTHALLRDHFAEYHNTVRPLKPTR
ncbi:MAG: NACHT domain-containing protein [Cyanobacteria bacterium P01_C01_bin.89]